MMAIMTDGNSEELPKEFVEGGRTGRRNAMPDILHGDASVTTADLPARLQQLATTDDTCSIGVQTTSFPVPEDDSKDVLYKFLCSECSRRRNAHAYIQYKVDKGINVASSVLNVFEKNFWEQTPGWQLKIKSASTQTYATFANDDGLHEDVDSLGLVCRNCFSEELDLNRCRASRRFPMLLTDARRNRGCDPNSAQAGPSSSVPPADPKDQAETKGS